MEKQCGAVEGLDKRLAWSYHLGGNRLKEHVDVSSAADAPVVVAAAAAVDVVVDVVVAGTDGHASGDMGVLNGVVDCSAHAM